MVRPAGLEPATFWFVAKHSIRLSYERIYTIVISSPAQKCGGEQGIRTLDTGFSPYTRLAGERLRPTRPTLHVVFIQQGWRRRWDSNPRDPFEPNGFQDRHLKPLGHPSIKWDYELRQLYYHKISSLSIIKIKIFSEA